MCGITYCNSSCLNFLLIKKIITVTTISPTVKTATTAINPIIVFLLSSSQETLELVLVLLVDNGTLGVWIDDVLVLLVDNGTLGVWIDDVTSGQMQTAIKSIRKMCKGNYLATVNYHDNFILLQDS